MEPAALIFFICLIAVAVGVLLLVALAVIVIVLVVRHPKGQQSQQQNTEETRMIQAMSQQLAKMEERVEALETILSDHGTGRQGR